MSLTQKNRLKPLEPANIHLLAALPQEYRAFQRRFHPRWLQRHKEPFRQFHCRKGRRDFYLTETGMGHGAIGGALQWILSGTPRPEFLVSFGYGGSLSGELQVGDVCLVKRVRIFEPSGEVTREFHADPDMKQSLEKSHVLQPLGVKECSLVTVKGLTPKNLLSSLCQEEHAPMAVDMESFHVTEAAHENGLPLLILRAISDGPEDEIMLDPASIADSRGRLSPSKVLLQVARKPHLVSFLVQSWKNSLRASRTLSLVLTDILDNGCTQTHPYQWIKGLE